MSLFFRRNDMQHEAGEIMNFLTSLCDLSSPRRCPLLSQTLFIMQMYDNSFGLGHPQVFDTLKEGEI